MTETKGEYKTEINNHKEIEIRIISSLHSSLVAALKNSIVIILEDANYWLPYSDLFVLIEGLSDKIKQTAIFYALGELLQSKEIIVQLHTRDHVFADSDEFFALFSQAKFGLASKKESLKTIESLF